MPNFTTAEVKHRGVTFPTSAYDFIHGWCGIISCFRVSLWFHSRLQLSRGATRRRVVLQKQVLAGAVGRPGIASRRRRCSWKMAVSKRVGSCREHDHVGRHGTGTRHLSCLLMFSVSPNNLYLSVSGCQDGWVPFCCGNLCNPAAPLNYPDAFDPTNFERYCIYTYHCCCVHTSKYRRKSLKKTALNVAFSYV